MEQLGGTPPPVSFQIAATAPPPETALAEPVPEAVRDIPWMPKVELAPSEGGATPYLAYRIDDCAWTIAERGTLVLAALAAGEHTILLAAPEGACARDATPVHVVLRYEPDFDFVVRRRIDAVAGSAAEKSKQAMRELGLAGPAILPALKEQLAEDQAAEQRVSVLQRMIGELERAGVLDPLGRWPPGAIPPGRFVPD